MIKLCIPVPILYFHMVTLKLKQLNYFWLDDYIYTQVFNSICTIYIWFYGSMVYTCLKTLLVLSIAFVRGASYYIRCSCVGAVTYVQVRFWPILLYFLCWRNGNVSNVGVFFLHHLTWLLSHCKLSLLLHGSNVLLIILALYSWFGEMTTVVGTQNNSKINLIRIHPLSSNCIEDGIVCRVPYL